MEIRIAHHPSSDISLNSISQILAENGIVSTIEHAAESGELRISVVKKDDNDSNSTQLDSSFVHLDGMPGY